ncbi:serine/threonine-protein kinase RsbT [Sinobaca qinghaiensis]|uniref:Serine/threonine-protein kinase RsbT n=1 Tax=Sinobaca qinghaiensis TaxID=342944 RepID=A0A419V493_9BACL|nr:anti-sigma regulatory factor [Sinobaca qinghaiensis]RKD73206.1 serine/threonine-protein kinase RsbT [Sinobaca qinghaiensis]
MSVQSSVEVHTEWGIVSARQAGRNLAKEIGFGSVDQARVTTAISELARNIYLYAEKGEIIIETIEQYHSSGAKKGIKITAKDRGPGIKNIREVMEDGFTTSGGLGAGLPGVKRLMDDFDIDSVVGEGTVITAVKWLR